MTGDQIDGAIVQLARLVPDGAFIGVGLGTPTGLVAAMLAARLRGGHVLAGGAMDVAPPVDRWIAGPDSLGGHTGGFVPHVVSMDWAERQTMRLQFLRPAQVDGAGNLNTSRLGPIDKPTRRFPGGLATGDVPQLLPTVITYMPRHQVRSTPERVPFVTGAGGPSSRGEFASGGVVALGTDLGVVEWERGTPRLAFVHPWTTPEGVQAATGFSLDVSGAVETTPPTTAEVAALEVIDPNRIRDKEWQR